MKWYCFFFNDTATTEIYTLSLHDALPISGAATDRRSRCWTGQPAGPRPAPASRSPPRRDASPGPFPKVMSLSRKHPARPRSEEHTSELQSRQYLVCRLLLEKKNNHTDDPT